MKFYPSLSRILEIMSKKKYRIYYNPDKPFDINIIGIRTTSLIPHKFDDWITIFYMMHGEWVFNAFPATTDPGLFYLANPEYKLGTAILKEGQYKGMFELGMHKKSDPKKQYKALVQKAEVTVYRDDNRDNQLDIDPSNEETGRFGINLHRASAEYTSIEVNKWSAGCQVICDPLQYNFLIDACERGAKLFGNSFTYTLLHERDFIQ